MDKLLNQFLAVADAGSISGAATTLLVTQPTLTFNMKKLEDSLGVPLFTRSSRGISLTRYGETLYENASVMRRLYDNTLAGLEQQRLRNERGLSIGSGYSWWSLFVRDFVVAHHERHPAAPILVSLGSQMRLMDQLLSGDIALFVGHEIEGLSEQTGAEFLPLSSVLRAYFVRAGHPLLSGPQRIEDIENYPQVTSTPPESRHQRFFDAVHRKTRSETVLDRNPYAFGSNALSACVDFVARTDAVLAHTDLMEEEFARRDIVRVVLCEPAQPGTVGLYVLSERRSEARIKALAEAVTEAARAALPEPPTA